MKISTDRFNNLLGAFYKKKYHNLYESLCQRWLWRGADGGDVVDGAVPDCGVVVVAVVAAVAVAGERGAVRVQVAAA